MRGTVDDTHQAGSPEQLHQDQAPQPLPVEVPASLAYPSALALTAVATGLALIFDYSVTIPNLSLIFVLPVVISAVYLGFGPSLLCAVLGAAAYNFFFTEPRFTLRVDDPSNVWAIGLLFVIGAIASAVASTAKRRSEDVQEYAREADVLRRYGHKLLNVRSESMAARATAEALTELFNAPSAVLFPAGDDFEVVAATRDATLRQADLQAVRAVYSGDGATRAGQYPAHMSQFDFWPVGDPPAAKAVIGLQVDPDNRHPRSDRLLDAIASVLAIRIDHGFTGTH